MSNENLIERLRLLVAGIPLSSTDRLRIEAAAALTAQAAEIEALRADAARYQWIKLMKVGRNPEFTEYWTFWSTPALKGKTLDEAMDAAMQSGRAVTP